MQRRSFASTLAIAVIGASWCAAAPAPTAEYNPALGALRVSGRWKGSTFILLTADGKGVELPGLTDVPFGSMQNRVVPPGYGPKGFWLEVKPGKYTLIASAPGKRMAQAAVEVAAGAEVWLAAELEEAQSTIRMSEPLDQKTGPTWSKADLGPVLTKLRWRK